jgi:hypothetical protein
VVVLFLGCSGFWGWILGTGAGTPRDELKNLESANDDIRWRAANHITQTVKRDDLLAADVDFGLQLVHLLTQDLDRLAAKERLLAERLKTATPEEIAQLRQDVRTQREHVRYLSACVGNLSLPLGVPSLVAMTASTAGPDEPTTVLLRRHAVWMLANLGENLKRFDKLTPEQQAAARQQLEQALKSDNRSKVEAAVLATSYLAGDRDLGVVPALDSSARSDDRFLRELVALALTFWEGGPAEKPLAEGALFTLAADQGSGRRIEIGPKD